MLKSLLFGPQNGSVGKGSFSQTSQYEFSVPRIHVVKVVMEYM